MNRVVMTGMQLTYVNAWRKVMGYEPEFILWCTWHVSNAWEDNYSKLKLVRRKIKVYQTLKRSSPRNG